MGRELILVSEQVVPSKNKDIKLSTLQERLIQKMGSSAYAFTFQLLNSAPASIIIQDENGEQKNPVGVEYDFITYVGDNAEDKSHKRSTVSMAIRKVSHSSVRLSSTTTILNLKYPVRNSETRCNMLPLWSVPNNRAQW